MTYSTVTAGKAAGNWWLVVLRGVLAILFGVAAFLWPNVTVVVLVLMFGAYALIDGIFAIIAALTHRESHSWGWLLVEGLVGVAAGVITFAWPEITTVALLYLIAAWALITGIFEIVAAIRLRHEIDNEWALALGGLISVALGVLMVLWPAASVLALVWLIAAYAITFGVLLIVLGFRLRHWSAQRGRVTLRAA
jgi:uncharacterized membrane protein HdeD (DUF308 family)